MTPEDTPSLGQPVNARAHNVRRSVTSQLRPQVINGNQKNVRSAKAGSGAGQREKHRQHPSQLAAAARCRLPSAEETSLASLASKVHGSVRKTSNPLMKINRSTPLVYMVERSGVTWLVPSATKGKDNVGMSASLMKVVARPSAPR
jgi:hypothetical protein